MNVPTKSQLIHLQIQAAMRENLFGVDDMKYLGIRGGRHLYLVAGKHEVFADQFEDFTMVDDD